MLFSLRSKLLLCHGLLVALTCGLAAYSLSAVDGASALLSQVYDEALIGISSGRTAAGKLVAARDLMDRAASAWDAATTEQVAALRLTSVDIEEDLKVVRARVPGPGVAKALADAEAAMADWLQSGLLILAPPPEGTASLPLADSVARKGASASAALDDLVDQVAGYGLEMRIAANAAMHASRVNMQAAALAISGIGVLLALGFAHLLASPIRLATRVAEHVASGDYTDHIEAHGRDELGRLLTSLACMRANLIGRAETDQTLLRRVRELADSTFEGLVIHRNGVVLDANVAFCSMVGLPLDVVRSETMPELAAEWEDALSGSMAQMREITIKTGDGGLMPVEIQSRNISYENGTARVTALRSIRERRETEERTRFLAHHDPLTGLPNRILLQERLAEARQAAGPTAALLFLDLDRFKAVNDTMGHAAGDLMLVEVARRLMIVAAPGNMVARLGGDEFVVLCRRISPQAVAGLAEAIRKTIEAPFELADRLFHISVSIGISTSDCSGNLDLIQAADLAMYSAKQSGGNQVIAFEPSHFDRVAQQLELDHDLRRALSGGDELVLLYQPIFASTTPGTTTLVGFEALVRWRHPQHGWMSPARFIPLAEKSGLILPLGNWVMTKALRQGRILGQTRRDAILSMNVNVSVIQLIQPGFCSSLSDMLLAEGVPPASLCLEVTESMLSDAAVSSVLSDIRKLGVRVAIDDFGVGYSSLSYLRRLPVDVVKLDRSFVEDVGTDPTAMGFIGAVVALAHSAGKLVVLEGIETQVQSDAARLVESDMVQGFLFAPPLSENAAQDLVSQHQRIDDLRIGRLGI